MGRARDIANLIGGATPDIILKTSDGAILNLQTSDTTVTQDSVLGAINFQAPDEADGTDAILVASKIEAIAEGTFSASSNATSLVFTTASSAAAGTASGKMTFTSGGELVIKDTDTADGSSPTITLQSGDTDIAQDDVLGSINFQAPDEGTGTDAILVAAGIAAVSEGDFSSSSNATKLSFKTGASEAAAEKMSLGSGGDLSILTDGASLFFGADSEIELRHVADDGLILKHVGTGDGKEPSFTFQAGDNDIAQDDVLGQINFQAPDEGAGTDAVLSAATIKAFSEGNFSASNNATTLELAVGRSAAAGSDGGRLRLTSNGTLFLKNQNTADDSKPVIHLQAGDTDIAQDDELGAISFSAPDEGTGTDAILTAAQIMAVSEGNFSSSNNATSLVFKTAASEAASEKMRILSTGQVLIGDATAPISEAIVRVEGDGTTDKSPFIEFANTSAGNDDTLGGFLSLIGTDSVAEVTARRESASDDAFLFFGTQKTGGSLTERFRILSGGNQVGKNGFFKASNASNQYYNGTDPSSGNWHEFNSSIGNEQILAITSHNTGTDNEGFVVRHVADTNNTSSGFISCANDVNGTKFKVEGNGNVESATNSYGAVSDERLKSNIVDANSQWDDIKALRFRNFKKYDTEDLVHLGLISQEAEKISPNIISDTKPSALDIKHDASFGTLYEDGDTIPDGKKIGDVKEIKEKIKTVKYSILYMKAVKALQEAMTRIETLETKVKTLEDA